MSILLFTAISGLLACGMGVALLGSVKLPLARRLAIDEGRVGGMVSMFPLAMIPVILGMGFLADLIGQQQVLIGGVVVMAISLVLLATAGRYVVALAAILLLSAGWSAQINVLNVITPAAFSATDSPAYATNLANFFFGLGAFLTPVFVAFLFGRAGFSKSLILLAGAVLITGVLAGFSQFQLPQAGGAEGEAPGFVTVLADPMIWILGFCLFFYGPLEASVAAWSTTIMTEKGISEKTAGWLLSGFWLAFMASRLATAVGVSQMSLTTGWETPWIIILSVVSIGVLAAMVRSRNAGIGVATVVLAGLVFGPIFPTVMGVLLGHFDPAVQGRAVGLFFAIGGIGWTGIPMLIGAYAKKTSVQQAFLVAVAAAVGLTLVAILLHFSLPAPVAG